MSGETEKDESGWTTDTLNYYLSGRIDDLRTLLDERYQTQQKAMETAFTAADKAVQAALAAQEKAITKAETAAEKRFECVSADTPILCADLIWRPAGDLLVGDELIACDETAPTRRGRRYRKAVVTDNGLTRDALLLVTTPEGSVRCNHHHPWLARRTPRSSWGWMKTEDLRPGDQVLKPLDVWSTDRSWEAGWLAGMYDGEGCLTNDKNSRSQLSITQRESDTSDRIEQALKARVEFVGSYRVEPGRYRHTQPFYHFIVTRLADVLTLLGSTRPPRLLANASVAWEGKPLGGWNRAAEVTAIEPAGTGVIANLSTSTGTYIAAGFAMHNSVNEFRATLADQQSQLLTRGEYDAQHDALVDKVNGLADRLNRSEGQSAGIRLSAGALAGTITAAAAIVALVVGLIVVLTR